MLERASDVTEIRLAEELSLKTSLESRAQFIVATGVTVTSLTFAGFVLAIDHGLELSLIQKALIMITATSALAAAVLGSIVVIPLPFKALDEESLSEAQQLGEAEFLRQVCAKRIESLKSLAKQNATKALCLFVGTLSVVASALCATGLILSLL